MPKIASRYFDTHTDRGCPLGQVKLPELRLHECGTMVLDGAWNFSRVRSPFWRIYFNRNPARRSRLEAGAGGWPRIDS